MKTWPLQSQCDTFYGNPRGANAHVNSSWKRENIVTVKVPVGFKMTYDGSPVSKVSVHRKCAEAVDKALQALWLASKKDAAQLKAWGISNYSGGFEYRLMRNSNHLSMHAYGCALDFDGGNRPLHSTKFFPGIVVKCFTDLGATNLSNDPMHFQFARVG